MREPRPRQGSRRGSGACGVVVWSKAGPAANKLPDHKLYPAGAFGLILRANSPVLRFLQPSLARFLAGRRENPASRHPHILDRQLQTHQLFNTDWSFARAFRGWAGPTRAFIEGVTRRNASMPSIDRTPESSSFEARIG